MPAVSVVIPLYNVESYIEECLESLMRQTLEDFEVICIDDGSTDSTLAIARQITKDDVRFSFYSQENAGQAAARNVGIDRAVGTYIVFLDSDDYYEDCTLQTLLERADQHNLDSLFFSARTVYENSYVRTLYRDEYDKRLPIAGVMSGRELLVQFAAKDSFCVSPAMQLIRREFLESSRIRFLEGIVHEDNLFTCLILAFSSRAEYFNKALYVRRVRPLSTMTEVRTIKHVYGHFRSAYELENWLRSQAERDMSAFSVALLRHIAFCYDLAAFDALSLKEEDLETHACRLPYDEEISFRLHVIEHARETRGIRSEYIESKTYRIGRAIMALPCKLKDCIGR